eukprot:3760415-Pyramimonas_sp.AAC.1
MHGLVQSLCLNLEFFDSLIGLGGVANCQAKPQRRSKPQRTVNRIQAARTVQEGLQLYNVCIPEAAARESVRAASEDSYSGIVWQPEGKMVKGTFRVALREGFRAWKSHVTTCRHMTQICQEN